MVKADCLLGSLLIGAQYPFHISLSISHGGEIAKLRHQPKHCILFNR